MSSSPSPVPPSTPAAAVSIPNTAQAPPPLTTRRSARVHKRDPIVAPGFGTQQDLKTLAATLEQPLAVVQAVMSSQGRGVRRRGQASSEEATAAPAVGNNAWANFLTESQHDPSQDNNDSSSTGGGGAATGTKDGSAAAASSSTAADADDSTRTYQLPLEPGWLTTAAAKSSKGKPKSKKAKIDSNATTGVLVQAGTLDATCVGRSKLSAVRSFDLQVPSILLPRIQFQKVISSCNAAHALAIDGQGRVYGWGRNETLQLGSTVNATNVSRPFLLEGMEHVVDGAVGKFHSMVLDEDQQLWAVGGNKAGQCGIKSSIDSVVNFRKCIMDANVVQVSCGEQFSVALDEDGYIYTTGSSEFGQLANGETGERIMTGNKLTFDNSNVFVKQSVFTHLPGEKLYGSASTKEQSKVESMYEDIRIGHVACGKNHCVAVEAPSSQNARVFSWGCGNYGCLGHGVQADEYRPRLVGTLSAGATFKANPPVSAAAGSSCSMVLTKGGHVYYWGKHRQVGEAVMRPTLLAELANNGHIAEHVAAGNQTVVISTKNAVTVAWGMGPHGELGLPGKKSSAKPVFVPKLDTCRMRSVACGYGTTYYIVKKEDKDDEAAVKQLDTVSNEAFVELETVMENVTASKKK